MAPNDKKSIAGTMPLKGPANDQNTTSTHVQGQTLLKALQELIVHVMNPKHSNDMNQIVLGPEAGKLINALQEFVSSIVLRSQSETPNTFVEVSLDDDEPQEDDHGDSGEANKSSSSKRGPLSENFSSESHGNTIGNADLGDLDLFEKPQPTFEEKLLRELREHVFNKMPIRLLCFELHGSTFRITLLERGALFARVASKVHEKIHENEFRPMKTRWGKTESEEGAVERLISKYAGYAILSHTWLRTAPGEVTYSDWNKGLFNSRDPGYRKLISFCKTALKNHGLTFGWMDTVCINKESSSELDESIRSMYNWYSLAAVCITYLAETGIPTNMHLDPWFTRGWTLQELIAPPVIKFYNGHWKRLVDHSDNDKAITEITEQIQRATTILKEELDDIHGVAISRRMQLAANREVTREEDTAYSLMGIFNVSVSTAYGEGAERAFSRLLQEILISSEGVLDILNWAGPGVLPSSSPYNSRVLPCSPQSYIKRSSNKNLLLDFRPIEPLTLSHLGLRVPVVLMPGISVLAPRHKPFGDYNATVHISLAGSYSRYEKIPTSYNLLDNRISGRDGWKGHHRDWYQMTFAVFNFSRARNITTLSRSCIALGIKCYQAAGQVSNTEGFLVIPTNEPIVFELSKITFDENSSDFDDYYRWHVKTDELSKHGMQLINMYL